MSTAAHKDLRVFDECDLSARRADLPVVYVYDKLHPQRPSSASKRGRTFVVLIDVTADGKRHELDVQRELKAPTGREAEMLSEYGLVSLHPGDWLFARDKDGDGDPADDMLQVMICKPDDEFIQAKRDRLDRCAKKMLGSEEDRKDGRAAFEKWPQARGVKGERAYPLGCMVQQPPRVDAPAAAFKIPHDTELDTEQKIIKEMVSAGSDLAISTWEQEAPTLIRQREREFSEAVNVPSVGCDGNYMFPALQMNIAQERGTPTESLVQDMGFFGTIHVDRNDDVTGFSCMTPLSELTGQSGEEPGRFHFITRGFYTNLDGLVNVYFSGRLPHGGTPPISPPGTVPPAWALRCVLICYPASTILSGESRHTLAAFPMHEPFYISPEMTSTQMRSMSVGDVGYTNYARDGTTIMEDKSLFDFFVRCLLLLCFYLCNQLPQSFGVRIDRQKFLESFTRQDSEGARTPATAWALGPDGPVRADPESRLAKGSAQFKRASVYADHVALYQFLARSIPGAADAYTGAFGSSDINPSKNKSRVSKGNKPVTRPKTGQSGKRVLQGRFGGIASEKVSSLGRLLNKGPVPAEYPGSDPVDSVLEEERQERRMEESEEPLGKNMEEEDLEDMLTRLSPADDIARDLREQSESGTVYGNTVLSSERSMLEQWLVPEVMQDVDDENEDLVQDEHSARKRVGDNLSDDDLPPAKRVKSTTETDSSTGSSSPASSSSYQPSDGGDINKDDEDDWVQDHKADDASGACVGSEEPTEREENSSDDSDDSYMTGPEYRFFDEFSENDITHQLLEARKMADQLQEMPVIPLIQALRMVNRVDTGQSKEKGLRIRADEVEVLFALRTLDAQARESVITSNLLRRRIMCAYHHVGTHLMTSIYKKVYDMSSDISSRYCPSGTVSSTASNPPARLLSVLVPVVHNFLENRRTHHMKFDSAELVDSLFGPGAVVIHPPRVYKLYDKGIYSGQELHERTADVVVDVLRAWFELPDKSLTQNRVRFLGSLISHLGYSALLLPAVWTAFTAMPSWLRDDLQETLSGVPSRFERILSGLDISDNCSSSFHKLFALGTEYVRLQDKLKELAAGTREPITRHPHIIDSDFDVDRAIQEDNVHPAEASVLGPEWSRWVGRTCNLLSAGQRIGNYVQFPDTGGRDFNSLESKIADQGDYLQPLRELGPARLLFNQQLSHYPQAQAVMTSPSGLFSLVIFRNILFRSKYLLEETVSAQDRRVLFSNLEDFSSHVDMVAKTYPEASDRHLFFCNKQAFSCQSLHTRSLDTAPRTWLFATDQSWSELMAKGVPPTFMEARSVLERMNRRIKLGGFGDLARYLVLADLCCHGVVQMPSTKDMGTIVYRLNKGGVKGLRVVQLLPKDDTVRASQVEVEEAFCIFYEGVKQGLDDKGLDQIVWNPVVAEHTLCKILRLQRDIRSVC